MLHTKCRRFMSLCPIETRGIIRRDLMARNPQKTIRVLSVLYRRSVNLNSCRLG